MDSSATGFRGRAEWAAPALKDLLPDLSREEQLWLENGGQPARRGRKGRRITKQELLSELPPSMSAQRTEGERDALLIRRVQDAICHYNARHQGGEFDAVKPLMEAQVGFRGQVWFHINFWARSRSTNKIKRFFAEVHYKPSSDDTSKYPCATTPIVEICTIIDVPDLLNRGRYREAIGVILAFELQEAFPLADVLAHIVEKVVHNRKDQESEGQCNLAGSEHDKCWSLNGAQIDII